MRERILTVCGQYNASGIKVPALMLKGIWLEDIGFQIGDGITINEKDGQLFLENKGKF